MLSLIKIIRSILFGAALIFGTGCGPDDSLQNQGFDAWCGEDLCLWETNEGKVKKTGTWHPDDYGAEFVDDPTIISQFVDSEYVKCFLFSVMADVDKDAALFLELDYLNDDIYNPDFSKKIEAPDWNKVKVDVAVPSWCDSLRVILRKTGAGRVTVASLFDERYDTCPMDIPDDDRPAGLICTEDADCRDGMCEPFIDMENSVGFSSCGTCRTHEDCESGSVCGLESATGMEAMHRACGEPGRHTLGERCLFDDECASTVCCKGQCSQCCTDSDCTDDAPCEKADTLSPHQCAPTTGTQPQDAPCLMDSDCRDDSCRPAGNRTHLSICSYDGRLCTSDADCPDMFGEQSIWIILTGETEQRDSGSGCVTLGVYDGVCRQ